MGIYLETTFSLELLFFFTKYGEIDRKFYYCGSSLKLGSIWKKTNSAVYF